MNECLHKTSLVIVELLFPIYVYSQSMFQVKVLDNMGSPISGIALVVEMCGKRTTGKTNTEGLYQYAVIDTLICDSVCLKINSRIYGNLDTVLLARSAEKHVLRMKSINLDEVIVKGYKRIVHADAEKDVFTIREEALPINAKADMALIKLPGIVKTDDGICLMGNKKSAVLFIDDMPASQEELTHLDASEIAKVEVRRIGLSSNADAGEINIIRKKNRQIKLKEELGLSDGLLRKHQGIKQDLSYRSKSFDIYSYAFVLNRNVDMKNRICRDGAEMLNTDNQTTPKQYTAYLKSNILFSTSFSASVNYSIFGYDNKSINTWSSMGKQQPEQKMEETMQNQTSNAFVRYHISRNLHMFLLGRYLNYHDKNMVSSVSANYFSRMKEYSGEVRFEADSMKTGKIVNALETSYKMVYRNSSSPSFSDQYHSNVHQLSFKDNVALAKNVNIYLLLRGEQYQYNFLKQSVRSFTFSPAATLNYSNGIGNFALSYQHSVIHPSIDYLNPQIFYVNENFQMSGNPNLNNQSADDFSLRYSLQIGSNNIGATASYSKRCKMIELVYLDNLNQCTYENAADSRSAKLNLNYNKPFLNNEMNLNLFAGIEYADIGLYHKYKDSSLSLGNRGWAFHGVIDLSYNSPHRWYFDLSGIYSNRDFDINYTNFIKPMLQLFVQKSMFTDKVDVSLSYMDMFEMFRKSHREYKLKNVNQLYYVDQNISNVVFNITVHLGKQFQKRTVGRGIENDDIITKQ
jgi:hypothetical protein